MDGMHLPVVLNTFISLDVIIKHIYFSAKIQHLSKSQGKQQLILSKSQGKHRCNGIDFVTYGDCITCKNPPMRDKNAQIHPSLRDYLYLSSTIR